MKSMYTICSIQGSTGRYEVFEKITSQFGMDQSPNFFGMVIGTVDG